MNSRNLRPCARSRNNFLLLMVFICAVAVSRFESVSYRSLVSPAPHTPQPDARTAGGTARDRMLHHTLAEDESLDDVDLQFPAGDDVAAALARLGECETVDCLVASHQELAGRTRFNLPHFFLIGWQKCATTSVVVHLRNHTQMLPSLIKESHWWSTCAKGADIRGCKARTEGEYLRTFLRVKEAAAANLEVATADTSADYAARGKTLATKLYATFPWLKIVIFMREPIARAISYTRMHTQLEHASKGCADDSTLYECLHPILAPGEGNRNFSEPLEGWLSTFPAEQVHVIQFEELQEDEERVLRTLKTFLGMDPHLPVDALRNVNNRAAAAGGLPMRLDQYRALVTHARADAVRAAAVLDAHGAADGAAFLERWEAAWRRVEEERCNDGSCLINSD